MGGWKTAEGGEIRIPRGRVLQGGRQHRMGGFEAGPKSLGFMGSILHEFIGFLTTAGALTGLNTLMIGALSMLDKDRRGMAVA